MPTYVTDIIKLIISNSDYTTLVSGVNDLIQTPDNGFLELLTVSGTTSGTIYYVNYDEETATYSGIYENVFETVYTDEWGDPTITTEDWLEQYYKEVYDNATRAQNGIVITISGVGGYPLPNYNPLTDTIFDEAITVSGVSYVEYEYPGLSYLDRVSLWSTHNSEVYISLSTNGTNWAYYKGSNDGSLTNGFFSPADDEDDAITYPWTVVSGVSNMGRFIEGTQAKYTRLHTTEDLSITELIYDKYKDLQSKNFVSGGLEIDLEKGTIIIKDSSGNIRVKIGNLL